MLAAIVSAVNSCVVVCPGLPPNCKAADAVPVVLPAISSLPVAKMFGGYPSPSVQHNFYDGSSWSTAPSLGTGRYYGALGPIGTSTAALMAGGNASPSPVTGVATEEFTSSANVITAAAWSSGSLMGTGRYQGNGQNVGTQTAGMYSGGQGSYPSTNPAVTVSNVEEYDGSSWSEVNNLPESKAMFGAVGTQTAAFVFGGYGGPGAGPNPGPPKTKDICRAPADRKSVV